MAEGGPKREVIKNLPTDNSYVGAIKLAMNDHSLTLEQAIARFKQQATADPRSGPQHLPGIDEAEKIIREQIKNKEA